MSPNNCSYCNHVFTNDRQNRPITSADFTQFHQQCLERAKNPEEAVIEAQELLKLANKWRREQEGWEYKPAYTLDAYKQLHAYSEIGK